MALTKSEMAKDRRLQKVYKSSLAIEQADMEVQNHCCAICERPFVVGANPRKTFSKASYQAFRDHYHGCCPRRLGIYCGRCNRGLLCMICNRKVIGVLERFAIPADRVAEYMAKWKHLEQLKREVKRTRAKRKKRGKK
jgi:hypothetical protein